MALHSGWRMPDSLVRIQGGQSVWRGRQYALWHIKPTAIVHESCWADRVVPVATGWAFPIPRPINCETL